MSCCIGRIDGLSESAMLAGATGGWTEVYRANFVDVFSALGAVDLNAAGNTVVIDGVTWETPSVARNGDAMVAAGTSFGITANGLECIAPGNSRVNPGNITACSIFASLRDISTNTSTPFGADPTCEYLFQAHVASENGGADHEWAGVFIFREGAAAGVSESLPGDPALYRAGYGFISATGPRALEGTGGTGGSPPRLVYRAEGLGTPLAAPDCPSIWYCSPQSYQFGGGAFGTDFPGQDELQFFSTARDATDVENDVVMHVDYGFYVGLAFCSENLSGNYSAVIDQFRILQR